VTPTLTFTCSICGEPSGNICVYCTKDACGNHLCERCHKCSDCCECEVRLEAQPEPVVYTHGYVFEVHGEAVEPESEPGAEPVGEAEAAAEMLILEETVVSEEAGGAVVEETVLTIMPAEAAEDPVEVEPEATEPRTEPDERK